MLEESGDEISNESTSVSGHDGISACYDTESDEEAGFYASQVKESLDMHYGESYGEYLRATGIGEEKIRLENVDNELWVINAIEDDPKEANQFELPPIGGVVVKGDLQMMTFPYFLRRSTRRKGQAYNEAAEN